MYIQDGNTELNVPSTDLFPIHHLDDLEFFPCDFVVSTSGNAVINESGHKVRSGIIVVQFMLWFIHS